MFLGHFATAFAAKRAAPGISLGTLILASQFIDLLFPLFLLLGLEHVRIDPGNTAVTPLDFYDYPLSHSLLAVMVWSVLFGAIYYLIRRSRRYAVVLGMLVVIHWLLDLISHKPDLPLLPGMDLRVGFGLWNFRTATFLLETALFAGGVLIYARSTRPLDRTGSVAFWSLVLLLFAIYLGNMFGPPPPNPKAMTLVSISQWLFVVWGYSLESHRTATIR